MEYELSYNLREQLTLKGIFAILKLNSSETARFFLQVQRNRFLTVDWGLSQNYVTTIHVTFGARVTQSLQLFSPHCTRVFSFYVTE